MCELAELEKRYVEVSSNCEKYLSKYTSCISSDLNGTVISKGVLYNLRPYEMERAGFKKGRKLNKLPSAIKNTHVYYFDKLDRIILIEIYGQSKNIVNRECCIYDGNCLERLHFTSAGILRNISVSFFEDSIVKKDINWGMYGCSISDYIYNDSVLEKIAVRQKEHKDLSFSEFDVIFKYKNDELESITNVFPNGYKEQRFP
ncbi:hypothetical protein DQD89_24320 [Salmonella enterica subsp. enterica]|uniref:Uncharacterized protein n=1 Tax=Salmonella enterica subsp. enterica serovar Kintambo TaxID=1192730 RepID=A0A5W7S191_SALET|nr:hypothetical protein [Salmonella enterica subsp. enterica serovar Kintambo]ECI6492933.1 hypothetical protein [Salmonella enterica subsp. enterica]MLP09127.1 hypothetical protein [Salmonella enterica subsp. enterica serovar Kedougou]HAK2952890.1 hypothetical protein [Salmonella enterica]